MPGTTILEGIRSAVGSQATVTYARGGNPRPASFTLDGSTRSTA